VNGQPVVTSAEFYTVVQQSPPNSPITYTLRQGSRSTQVTLESQIFTLRDYCLLFGAYLVATNLFLPLFWGCKRRTLLACCGDYPRRRTPHALTAPLATLVERTGAPPGGTRLCSRDPSATAVGGHLSVGGADSGRGTELHPAISYTHGARPGTRGTAGVVGPGITQA